jgi:paired amphipathic helix protein Sin3a
MHLPHLPCLAHLREEYEEHKADMWYAVPLSEIDFTQCRKCTPSYRALPKDYPRIKCTERSEEEARLLNDQVCAWLEL